MTFLKKICGISEKPSEKDFSAFFTQASDKDKSKLLKQVVREANQDQKRLMEEVDKILQDKKTAKV